MLHILDYEEAFKLVKWIDERIKQDEIIYIHCAAGVSRSQAIVRYILDTYFDHQWKTRKENPPICPNIHVVRMLKRMFLYHEKEFYPMDIIEEKSGYINASCYDTEKIREISERIKLNVIS
jgi:protein tyrosine phosphatase